MDWVRYCVAALKFVVISFLLEYGVSPLMARMLYSSTTGLNGDAHGSQGQQCSPSSQKTAFRGYAKHLHDLSQSSRAATHNAATLDTAAADQHAMPRNTGKPALSNGERQAEVVAAFRHAWHGYRTHAWGKDMLRPVSRGHEEWFGLGMTIVDSLDTMHLMGLEQEFAEARLWVEQNLDVRKNMDVNVFETTIRIVGGLLGAYHLSLDSLFKEKAIQLADSLIPAFATGSGIPLSDINLFTGNASPPKWAPESSIAEVTTLQMEFREISRLTGDAKYQDAVDKAMEHVQSQERHDGLVHLFINPYSGVFKEGTLTLGARADSYYEYLLKQWLQCNRTEDRFINWYRTSVAGIEKRLMRHSSPSQLLFVGEELNNGQFSPKMDHLVCFLPGLLALGSVHGADIEQSGNHLELARQLMVTCQQMYVVMPTGLSAELVYFGQGADESDIIVKERDRHNLLRPEAVESLFILYRITGNETYRDWGWEVFQAFEKHCKVEGGGYTSIGDVSSVHDTKPQDRMESFFLAETLKYLYLL
eukprot:scpid71106/ scgid2537/ Endoplasmic reticulum mannosyl-oligosaccharide 1,2-alpha-mannosidase; ER alpha-1,2-mannosidase; ER mannosidase 1; Mannosidase alpha class 1B member 1